MCCAVLEGHCHGKLAELEDTTLAAGALQCLAVHLSCLPSCLQGKPRLKPPYPANVGLYGCPTTSERQAAALLAS
jgi:hypothetical protein